MENLHNKLVSRGVASLDDRELLALMVEAADDKRSPLAVADALLSEYGSLANISHAEISRLRMSEGLGLKRAERLIVAAEIGRRVGAATSQNVESISSDGDVARVMRPLFDGLKHEECWVLYLTSSNRLIERQRVSQGGVQATVVDHRLVVKRALELLATNIILTHNHPSGAAEPSGADRTLTQRVKDAAALFDINLLDHVIISSEGSYSFRKGGLL